MNIKLKYQINFLSNPFFMNGKKLKASSLFTPKNKLDGFKIRMVFKPIKFIHIIFKNSAFGKNGDTLLITN